MAKKKDKWMQSAVKRPGALTAAAKKAGMSISQYCSGSHYSGLSTHGKQMCNFYKRAKGVAKKHKGKGK